MLHHPAAVADAQAGAARALGRHAPTVLPRTHNVAAAMRPLRLGHAAQLPQSLSILARQAAPTTASTVSTANPSSHSHSTFPGTDRHVIQSEIKNMSAEQLLRFDNSSGLTIDAIIAVVCALGGVFIICILVAAILSWTNAPRHEAYPYAQVAGQPALYQPSASAARNGTPKHGLAADYDDKPAGGTSVHSRTGSSGIGFPGAAHASRRGPAAAQYQTRSPSASPYPQPAARGTVNYNGREMTINMAGPEADESARAAAQSRLDHIRMRRSMVVGGPPPLTNSKRASRYGRSSTVPPRARMSVMGRKMGHRMSRQASRTSNFSTETTDQRGGNLSARRRGITSTGAGMVRTPSDRLQYEDDSSYAGSRRGGRRSMSQSAGRHPHSPRRDPMTAYDAAGSTSMILTKSDSMYDDASIYHPRDPDWAAVPTSQTNLVDPLHAYGPNPFVMAHG